MSDAAPSVSATATPRRAGFWRRLVALFFDYMAILIVAPFLFAVLYPLSGGALQWRDMPRHECAMWEGASDGADDEYSFAGCVCSRVQKMPEGMPASVREGAALKQCRTALFSWKTENSSGVLGTTGAWITGSREDGEAETLGLDPGGRPRASLDIHIWRFGILIAYLVIACALRGRGLGGWFFRARLVRRNAPQARGVGWMTALKRYCALTFVFLPLWGLELAGTRDVDDVLVVNRPWFPFAIGCLCLAVAWVLAQAALVVMRRDTLADRFAETMVIEAQAERGA